MVGNSTFPDSISTAWAIQSGTQVSVKTFETTNEDLIQLEIVVSEDDLGRVIGKDGKTINSIRNIVQASSTLNGGKKVKINVDSY